MSLKTFVNNKANHLLFLNQWICVIIKINPPLLRFFVQLQGENNGVMSWVFQPSPWPTTLLWWRGERHCPTPGLQLRFLFIYWPWRQFWVEDLVQSCLTEDEITFMVLLSACFCYISTQFQSSFSNIWLLFIYNQHYELQLLYCASQGVLW